MKTARIWKLTILVGIIFLIIAGAVALLAKNIEFNPLYAAGIVLVVTGVLGLLNQWVGFFNMDEDERTKKLFASAGAYSWFATFALLNLLLLLDIYNVLNLGSLFILSMMPGFMFLTALAIFAYMWKRGDAA